MEEMLCLLLNISAYLFWHWCFLPCPDVHHHIAALVNITMNPRDMTNITDRITDGTIVPDMVQDTMARDMVQGFMEEAGTAGNVRYHFCCSAK